jgi:putative phosphoesterase
MRIAILGDIHGNLGALRAVYGSAADRVDRLFHLGDLGGYAPFVNEVVDFVREHGIEGVQGNYDEAVAHDRPHCGCKSEDLVQERMADLSFEWTKAHTRPEAKAYLKSLPPRIELSTGGKRVVLFHASPLKNNLYWYEDRPDRFFREMAARVEADIYIYGHTHRPYRKDLEGKVFINAGSVGRPKDGDPRACVALVEVMPDAVRTEFLRVEYDVEAAAEAIVAHGLPEYFAEKLRRGE